eukprot:4852130-Lingulodinium_polyedra.AAC.1
MPLNSSGVTAEELVQRASERTPIVRRALAWTAQARKRIQKEEQRWGIQDMPIQFLLGERVE